MTFKQLKQFVNSLTEDQLEERVRIFLCMREEFIAADDAILDGDGIDSPILVVGD